MPHLYKEKLEQAMHQNRALVTLIRLCCHARRTGFELSTDQEDAVEELALSLRIPDDED
jgi:hypothetical protein